MGEELLGQGELARREVDLGAVDENPPGSQIKLEPRYPQQRVGARILLI